MDLRKNARTFHIGHSRTSRSQHTLIRLSVYSSRNSKIRFQHNLLTTVHFIELRRILNKMNKVLVSTGFILVSLLSYLFN